MEGGERRADINVSFANVQSIVNKMDEVRAFVSLSNCDIMAITETWANDEIDGWI